jgi:ketosteroid isomerase-like protein
VERSGQIESLVHDLYDAMKRGDAPGIAGLVANDASVLMIGTDPDEWWSGRDRISAVFRDQVEAMGGSIELVGGEPEGYAAGDVGWFADRPSFKLPDATEVPTRLTGAAIREAGVWKFVQTHISIGVANEEAIGQALPT